MFIDDDNTKKESTLPKPDRWERFDKTDAFLKAVREGEVKPPQTWSDFGKF